MKILHTSLRPTVVASFALAVTFLVGALGLGLLVGPRLMDFEPPPEDIGHGGLPLLVRFAPDGRVSSATFRVSLNGADVTERLFIAQNGAEGTLVGFLEGENVIELSIYGESWFPRGVWVPETRTFMVRFRPRADWNRG